MCMVVHSTKCIGQMFDRRRRLLSEAHCRRSSESVVDLRILCTGVIRGCVSLASNTVKAAGVTLTQWGVLERRANGQSNTISALTELVPVDQASISRTAHQLVRLGLLRRQRQSRDRRVVRLEATDKGQALVRQFTPEILAVNADLLNGVQVDEPQVYARAVAANASRPPIAKGGR